MIKINVINNVKKTVSIITMAGFLGLSTLQPAIGFEFEPYGTGNESQIMGIGFSGSLDFKNLRVTGFSYSPMKGIHGNFSAANNSLLRAEDGLVKVDLPLFTFGADIKYPGIFYNHNGKQFYQYIINSTEGDEAAQMAMTPYVLIVAGVIVGVAVFAYSGSSSSSDSASSESTADADAAQMDTTSEIQEIEVAQEQTVQEVPADQGPAATP